MLFMKRLHWSLMSIMTDNMRFVLTKLVKEPRPLQMVPTGTEAGSWQVFSERNYPHYCWDHCFTMPFMSTSNLKLWQWQVPGNGQVHHVLDTAHFIGTGTATRDDILCEHSGMLSNEGSMKVSEGSTVVLCSDSHVMSQLNDSSLILSGWILHPECEQLTMPHYSCFS
jgi:hypothetical protein